MAVTADQERTVNFYFEQMESQGATAKYALLPRPGVNGLATASASPGRAHFYEDGREFAVIGTTLYEISEAGTFTSRGTVSADSNPATISSNGDGGGELLITSGGNAYYYTLSTNTLAQIAALNGKATMGAHLDGYGLVLDASTSTLYISDLLDMTTWDPTQFAQRSAASDPWLSMKVVNQYIWLFGTKTSEVWYDAGTSPFPFAKHPSGLVPYGIAAAFSVAVADGAIFWLGASSIGERFALKAAGFTPEVVSDYPTQLKWSARPGNTEYDDVSNAVADTMNYLGHTFYMLTFPSVTGPSWVLDASNGRWVEWGTWIAENNTYVGWRPRWHALAFGQHRMLDAETGDLYQITQAAFGDVDSRVNRKLRRAPALEQENQRIFYSSFELDLEAGIASTGTDPQITMRMSNDGGKTWVAEAIRPAGQLGRYNTRVIWRRQGSARRRVYEIVMTDTYAFRITGAYLTLAQPLAGQRGAAA